MKRRNLFITLFFIFSLILILILLFNLKLTFAEDMSILFEGERDSSINVCFIDDFELEKEYEKSHGEEVIEVFQNYTNVTVRGYSHKDVNFDKKSSYILSNCDILNYSMTNKNRSKSYLNNIDDFMESYKGYLIVASGNEGDSSERSQWSYIKKNYPDKNWLNRLYIIGQGIVWDSDNNDGTKEMNVIRSYGEEINYIFDKKITIINDNYFKGSSFSSPVFSSILLNNLSDNKFDLNKKFQVLPLHNKSLGLDFKDNNVYNTVIFND